MQQERTWGEWFQSFSGTSQQQAPLTGTVASTTPIGEGGVGGRKKRRSKTQLTRRSTKKSRVNRKSKPRRK